MAPILLSRKFEACSATKACSRAAWPRTKRRVLRSSSGATTLSSEPREALPPDFAASEGGAARAVNGVGDNASSAALRSRRAFEAPVAAATAPASSAASAAYAPEPPPRRCKVPAPADAAILRRSSGPRCLGTLRADTGATPSRPAAAASAIARPMNCSAMSAVLPTVPAGRSTKSSSAARASTERARTTEPAPTAAAVAAATAAEVAAARAKAAAEEALEIPAGDAANNRAAPDEAPAGADESATCPAPAPASALAPAPTVAP